MVDRDQQNPRVPGATQRQTAGYTATQNTQSDDGSTTDQMQEKAGHAAHQAREKAGAMADSATQAVDERRGQASEVMDGAANQLRERGESLPGGERTTEMASMAADKVEATSTYIREHDVQDMMSDLETVVRNNPTQSLIVAAAAGFLVGRMLRG